MVKLPPTNKLVPETASAATGGFMPTPLIPEPKADQELPFHWAM